MLTKRKFSYGEHNGGHATLLIGSLFPLYQNPGYTTGTGVAKEAPGLSPSPPRSPDSSKKGKGGRVGNWSMPLHITYP